MREERLARAAIAVAAGLWVSIVLIVLQPKYSQLLGARPASFIETAAFTTMILAGAPTAMLTYLVTRNEHVLKAFVAILIVAAIWGAFAAVWPSINPFPMTRPDIRA